MLRKGEVVKIQSLSSEYIQDVVKVHIDAFPGFFLTFLGPRFLHEFYSSFLVDDAGVGFVALDGSGEVLGAIVGPVVPDGYFKRLLKRRWWAFCLASFFAVLKKPSVLKRLFRAVFYRGESLPGPVRSLLSSIAVSQKAQGYGVGRSLVKAWLDEIELRGSSGAYLSTDAKDNEATNKFYQKCGWSLNVTKTTPEGRAMNYYVFDFAEKDDSGNE